MESSHNADKEHQWSLSYEEQTRIMAFNRESGEPRRCTFLLTTLNSSTQCRRGAGKNGFRSINLVLMLSLRELFKNKTLHCKMRSMKFIQNYHNEHTKFNFGMLIVVILYELHTSHFAVWASIISWGRESRWQRIKSTKGRESSQLQCSI